MGCNELNSLNGTCTLKPTCNRFVVCTVIEGNYVYYIDCTEYIATGLGEVKLLTPLGRTTQSPGTYMYQSLRRLCSGSQALLRNSNWTEEEASSTSHGE